MVIGIVSCKESSKLKTDSSIVDASPIEDCIFDQETQTDDFIKGIKELKGYVWNANLKTAKVTLNNHWLLEIARGGCDHFELSATFKSKAKLDLEKDRDTIFNKIVWITSLIEEFEGEAIKETIENNKLSITKESESFSYVNFMNQRLYNEYTMYYGVENDTTSFTISYNLN